MHRPRMKTAPPVPKDKEAASGADIAAAYTEIRTALMRFAARYLKKPQEIEDVVQEACVKALEAQNRTAIHSPKSYLFRTTRNLAFKHLAKSANRLTDYVGESALEAVLEESTTLEEEYEARERFELFCRAVRSLPVKCRRTFVLRKVYGFSPPEIAAQLGISVKTVEGHIAKGIVRCTEFMDAEEGAGGQTRDVVPQPEKQRAK